MHPSEWLLSPVATAWIDFEARRRKEGDRRWLVTAGLGGGAAGLAAAGLAAAPGASLDPRSPLPSSPTHLTKLAHAGTSAASGIAGGGNGLGVPGVASKGDGERVEGASAEVVAEVAGAAAQEAVAEDEVEGIAGGRCD